MNNVNWEAVGIFLVLVGMIANLAVLVIGRPKSLQALKEGQDEITISLKVLMNQNDQINRQLKAQWEKIDLHSEMLIEYGKQLAIIKDRCDRRRANEKSLHEELD